ncbi:hypothetical protein ACS0TY_034135 [Phlomoides rotata]
MRSCPSPKLHQSNRGGDGFKYRNSSAVLRHRGNEGGSVQDPAGRIESDSTKPMNLTLTLMADRLISDASEEGSVSFIVQSERVVAGWPPEAAVAAEYQNVGLVRVVWNAKKQRPEDMAYEGQYSQLVNCILFLNYVKIILRNLVLSVWNNDVSRMLPLADFGVSDAPLVGESPRASLIRDVFTFLDQFGYINFGVPSEKEKEKSVETCIRWNNEDAYAGENLAGKVITEHGFTNIDALESSAPCVPEQCLCDNNQGTNSLNSRPLKVAACSEYLCSNPSSKDKNGKVVPPLCLDLLSSRETVSAMPVKLPKSEPANLSNSVNCARNNSGARKNVIVVGAGPTGLTAARHLQRQGFIVTVQEARSRIGGHVFTDRSSLSVPVDLGASIITGVEADVDTERRPDLDEALEAEYNSLLDDMELLAADKGEWAMKMSLEDGLEYGLKSRRMAHPRQGDLVREMTNI